MPFVFVACEDRRTRIRTVTYPGFIFKGKKRIGIEGVLITNSDVEIWIKTSDGKITRFDELTRDTAQSSVGFDLAYYNEDMYTGGEVQVVESYLKFQGDKPLEGGFYSSDNVMIAPSPAGPFISFPTTVDEIKSVFGEPESDTTRIFKHPI